MIEKRSGGDCLTVESLIEYGQTVSSAFPEIIQLRQSAVDSIGSAIPKRNYAVILAGEIPEQALTEFQLSLLRCLHSFFYAAPSTIYYNICRRIPACL